MGEQTRTKRLQNFFIEFNLFKSGENSAENLRIQRWSTRLYIPILSFLMTILLVYTSLQTQSKQIQIPNPSLQTYTKLYQTYPNAECPCKQISISYKTFTELSAKFHQVCSSDFVSEEWIRLLYEANSTTLRYVVDFRATAFNQFQILRQLCQLSSTTISDGIEAFYQKSLISGKLLNKDLFSAQVQSDISTFTRITTEEFLRSLTFMRSFMSGNELLTVIETAYTLIIDFQVENLVPPLITNFYTEIDGTHCGCDSDLSCHMTVGFYDFEMTSRYDASYNLTQVYPREFLYGWKVACWPMESLLLSTLESFYNQTIVNRIVFYMNSSALSGHFKALNSSRDIHFTSNEIIEDLANELFVDQWLQQSNYSSYYSQCQPQYCQYDVSERPAVLYIITSLLGLYGGLSVVLHLIIPYFISFILQHLQRQTVVQEETVHHDWSLRQWIRKIVDLILHLNLFRSALRNAPNDLKQQIWSTRLYLCLIFLSFSILMVYSSVIQQRRIIQLAEPSFETVQQLETKGHVLTCPCAYLSINYEYLFELQANYHQVCSSEFVSERWIDYLNTIADSSEDNYDNRDFRTIGSSIFHLLSSMCTLSQTTVLNALYEFNQRQLITNELLSLDIFTNQINAIIQQFQITLPNNLLSLLQLIRNLTNVNQFISGGYSNFAVLYSDNQTIPFLQSDGFVSTFANGTTTKCYCSNDFTCQTETSLFHYNEDHQPNGSYYHVPNFYTGCYPIESLLRSTLQCFYENSPCFDIVNNITDEELYQNFTRLNSNRSSRFAINITVDDLLQQLFIDSWLTTLNYSSYFQKCQPIYCEYTILQRKDAVEIVTTITGLIGGLATIFKLVSPYVISIIFYLIRRFMGIENSQNENRHDSLHLRDVPRKLREILLNVNIFEGPDNLTMDSNKIRREKQSTRLYFILLCIALSILIIYTSLVYQNNQIVVEISSLNSFLQFQDSYNSTFVDCSCTTLSIIQSTFYEIEPTFHAICSSEFIAEPWLDMLLQSSFHNGTPTNVFTFNDTAFAQFRTLSVLCDLTKQVVLDGQELFLQTKIVSSQMPNKTLFDLQTAEIIDEFKSSLPNTFLHNLQMFLGLAQGNGFISIYSADSYLYVRDLDIDPSIYLKSQSYDDCDCALSSACVQNSIPNIDGYFVGCSPLESLLQSTFQCLYNQECILQMSSAINSSFLPTPLSQIQSKYPINSKVDEIVEQMFIESWSINISYENFFDQCQPKSCSYIETERYNIVYMMTILLGLYGGITVLLKLTVPLFIHQFSKFINGLRRRNHRIVPV
ncbi:unnamed protein product [Adineta ricciae]|uniref:Uncharacterized protein n=1 Tax=Adineta ricciae TaxID=249248 RepID=A0A815T3P3_ADIRI|nr:unnamed protein product [Adineta ricciae]CAF1498472.1 unnamed protein product [Adineta ricciae]